MTTAMKPRRAAVVGGGVIGGGWVARLVQNGVDVGIFDPDPEAPRKIGDVMANADHAVARLTMAPLPERGEMRFAASIAEAVADAELIIEAVPERLDVKQAVYAEIEAFDTGHLWFAKHLAEQGLIDGPALVQLCMGIPWGAPDDLNTLMAMVNNLPQDWVFSAFSIGRNAMAYPAAAVLAGGNVRVGLEDNLYLSRGVFATNAQLVEQAVTVVENMGASIVGPEAVRERLGLTKRAPVAR